MRNFLNLMIDELIAARWLVYYIVSIFVWFIGAAIIGLGPTFIIGWITLDLMMMMTSCTPTERCIDGVMLVNLLLTLFFWWMYNSFISLWNRANNTNYAPISWLNSHFNQFDNWVRRERRAERNENERAYKSKKGT